MKPDYKNWIPKGMLFSLIAGTVLSLALLLVFGVFGIGVGGKLRIVLGVVLAMGKINEPPEVLGHYIGAALVGTFFGILCCYGLFGPMGAKLENFVSEEHFYYHSIKEAVAAAIRGSTPLIAVEYGRRTIPYPFRPTFAEMEEKLESAGLNEYIEAKQAAIDEWAKENNVE